MAVRFRDVKRKGRRVLHQHMQTPALYLVTPTATPIPCNVRLHTRFDPTGPAGAQWAEIQEITPKIVFMLDQIPRPRGKAIVSVQPGEAYIIDNTEEPDDITIKAVVTRIASNDPLLLTLPVPDA